MRIISCHIDNFGKINNFDYKFHENNFNIIKQDNAWGKTTFSVFIKAMLYGMDYQPRKKTEREMYEPWQGGVYGGSLEIETDGKRYRIQRSFGKKDKEDVLKIIDISTGKECSDFGENIGEEIFKIDKESFAKSVYIPQCMIETGMTDDFSAKMSNLSKVRDDISNFENVKKEIQSKMKYYSSRGKNSIVSKYNEELKVLKQKERERLECINVIEEIEGYIRDKKKQRNLLIEEKAKWNEYLVGQSKNTENIALYKSAEENIKIKEEKISYILEKYNGKEPDEVDVRNLKESYENIKGLREQLKVLDVNEKVIAEYKKYSELFKGGVPSDDFLSIMKNDIDLINQCKMSIEQELMNKKEKEYDEIKDFFSRKLTNDEEINKQIENYHISERLRKEILNHEIEKSKLTKINDSIGTNIIPYVFVGSILVILGMVLTYALSNALWQIGTIMGLVTIVFGLVSGKKNSKVRAINFAELQRLESEIDIKESKANAAEKEYREFIRCFRVGYSDNVMDVFMEIRDKWLEYQRLQHILRASNEKISENTSKMDAAKNRLAQLLEVTRESDFEELYYSLLNGVGIYIHLKEKMDTYNSVVDRLKIQQKIYSNQLEEYGSEDISIEELEKECIEITRIRQEIEAQLKIKNELGAEIYTDMSKDILSVEQIKEKVDECDREINVLLEDMTRYQRDVEGKYMILEETDDIESEIEQKKCQLNECAEKYKLLEMALDYLQKSKERLTSKYLGPMRQAFANYITHINGVGELPVSAENLELDIDMIPHLNYGAQTKGKESLSQGYRDLVDLCIRFAIIDAIFENESPVLILDDPFVNLDETKTENAIKILKHMSKKYQIIYFTCHDSRADIY